MLADFCQRNGISLPEVQNTTAAYTEIEKRVDQLNEEFITKSLTTEKEYLDNILKPVDPAVSLDDDQRRVVLTDEDYCLIIAGAGAGKTTTVAAKVKYLVDRQGIKPSQILVVSFTNKAVNELKEKIQSALGIPCPIATFHSAGNAIIHVNTPAEKLNIVDNSRLYFVIRDYFRGSVMQNESIVNKLIMFFASYFDAPYEGDDFNAFFNNIAKANYSTMRSDLEDFKCQVIDARTKKSVTIQNEVLRSHQEVEIANFLYLNNIDFIQRNSQQIPKQLISPKRIEDPIVIYTYDSTFKGRDGNRRSGANYALASAVETAIGQLLEYKKKENKEPGPILFLGRFGFDGDHLERSGLFEYSSRGSKIKSVKYPKLDITFMTAHSSKGLGYDDVIIVNGKNETYGFPSKIEDDPVLAFVIKGDKSIDYAEERRLFYVAMTRTKNRVFFIAPEQNPSEFLLELKRDYKNVVLHGDWNEDEAASKPKKACPLCGYPMQLKYKKAYGLRLYLCTNEPEVCGFMTNDVRGGKLSIQKCDKCRDGYLIVKQARDSGFLLGCTNYNRNGTGCNNVVNKKLFYEQMGYEIEEEGAARVDEQEKTEAVRTDNPVNARQFPRQLTVSAPSASQPAPRLSADRRLEDDSIEIVLADIPSVMYGNYELNHLIFTVVKALQNISRVRYYGATVLAEVLKGTDSKKVFNSKLDKLPEFGALRDMPYDTIKAVVDWMIVEHLILKTKGKYPVLHSTHEGLHYSEVVTEGKLKGLKKYLEGEAID